MALSQDSFKTEICRARTFGFLKDAEALRAQGLARGASLDNAVVINGENKVLNEGGLRFDDDSLMTCCCAWAAPLPFRMSREQRQPCPGRSGSADDGLTHEGKAVVLAILLVALGLLLERPVPLDLRCDPSLFRVSFHPISLPSE